MCVCLISKENCYMCKYTCTCCSKYVNSKSTSSFKWIMIKTCITCRYVYYDKMSLYLTLDSYMKFDMFLSVI